MFPGHEKCSFHNAARKITLIRDFFAQISELIKKIIISSKKTVFLPNVPQETEKAPLTLLLLSFP